MEITTPEPDARLCPNCRRNTIEHIPGNNLNTYTCTECSYHTEDEEDLLHAWTGKKIQAQITELLDQFREKKHVAQTEPDEDIPPAPLLLQRVIEDTEELKEVFNQQ